MKLSKLLKVLDCTKIVLYDRYSEDPIYEGMSDNTPFWIAEEYELEDNKEILDENCTRPISVRENPHVLVILLRTGGEK